MDSDKPGMRDRAAGKSDWAMYRRLLSYVGRYWVLLIFAFIGFVTAAAAEGYFVTLFGNLIDDWDNAKVRAAATIPMMMALVTVARAVGAIVGEAAMSRVSFGVVYDLREQLFGHILQSPSSYFDNANQGHIVSQITFTVTQLMQCLNYHCYINFIMVWMPTIIISHHSNCAISNFCFSS